MNQWLTQLAIGMPGPFELTIILVVAVLLFGRRLPEIARNIGKSMTEFKKGLRDAQETKNEITDDARNIGKDVVDDVKKAAGLDETNEG